MADDDIEEIQPPQEASEHSEGEEEEEYNVEDIRAKRFNKETKTIEYLIKWENYPESDNTWEPADNVMCPDLIIKFNEREEREKAKKRNKRRASNASLSTNESQQEKKKPRKDGTSALLLEEDTDIDSTGSSTNSRTNGQQAAPPPPKQPTGFERGTLIENILGSCTDDGDKLYFFVQFKGAKEIDMVDYEEIVANAPRQLCDWYKQRQYELLKQYKGVDST